MARAAIPESVSSTRRNGKGPRRNGQTLAEYAFILMLVALVCVAAVTLLGTSIQGFYTGFSGSF